MKYSLKNDNSINVLKTVGTTFFESRGWSVVCYCFDIIIPYSSYSHTLMCIYFIKYEQCESFSGKWKETPSMHWSCSKQLYLGHVGGVFCYFIDTRPSLVRDLYNRHVLVHVNYTKHSNSALSQVSVANATVYLPNWATLKSPKSQYAAVWRSEVLATLSLLRNRLPRV